MSKSFTLTELLVVIAVIIIILMIAVPAFSTMALDAKMSSTLAQMQGSLRRLQVVSRHSVSALRIMPSKWIVEDHFDGQSIMAYDWTWTYDKGVIDPNGISPPSEIQFSEHLARRPGWPVFELPRGIGIAPLAVYDSPSLLSGEIGRFEEDPTERDFLNADDFLIPLLEGELFILPDNPLPIHDYNFEEENEGFMRRYHFNTLGRLSPSGSSGSYQQRGFIIYQRKPVLELGKNASAEDRLFLIEKLGRRYSISPKCKIDLIKE